MTRNDSRAKLITVNAPTIQASSLEPEFYALSQAQIQTLLAVLAPIHWSTRWEDLPSDFDFRAFASELENNLMSPLNICQLIADCINDANSPVQDALKDWMQGNSGGNNGSQTLPIAYNRPNVGGGGSPTLWGESCDKDNLYAMITGMVDLTHTTLQDIAQLMETASNSGEQIANAIAAIPVLSELPYDAVFDFVDNFMANMGESYDAAYTQFLRDTYACELFCIAVNSCAISFEDFADYFSSRVSTTISNITWLDVINFLLSGTWTGSLIVDAAHYLFYAALSYGSSVLGLNVPYLSRVALSLMNDSNPDWETLCLDCAPDDPLPNCVEWNNLSGENWDISFQYIGTVIASAVIDNTFGNNLPSAKAGFVNSGTNYGRYINVRVTFTEPMRVQSASMQYWYNDGGNDSPRRRISLFDANGVALANQQLDTSGAPKSEWVNHEWTGDVSGVAYMEFNFRHWGTNTAIFNEDDTSAWLDNICMEVEPDGSLVRLEGYGNAEITSLPELSSPAATYDSVLDIYVGQKDAGNTAIFFEVEYNFTEVTLISSVNWHIEAWRIGANLNSMVLRLDGTTVHEVFPTSTGDYVDFNLVWTGSQAVSKIAVLGGLSVDASNGGAKIGKLIIGV